MVGQQPMGHRYELFVPPYFYDIGKQEFQQESQWKIQLKSTTWSQDRHFSHLRFFKVRVFERRIGTLDDVQCAEIKYNQSYRVHFAYRWCSRVSSEAKRRQTAIQLKLNSLDWTSQALFHLFTDDHSLLWHCEFLGSSGPRIHGFLSNPLPIDWFS